MQGSVFEVVKFKLRKYDESIGNFSLILDKRPALIASAPLYKVAGLIGLLHVHARPDVLQGQLEALHVTVDAAILFHVTASWDASYGQHARQYQG